MQLILLDAGWYAPEIEILSVACFSIAAHQIVLSHSDFLARLVDLEQRVNTVGVLNGVIGSCSFLEPVITPAWHVAVGLVSKAAAK